MTLELTCHQYLAAIPWPEMVFACFVGFLVGALLGVTYGRAHPRSPFREKKGRNHD